MPAGGRNFTLNEYGFSKRQYRSRDAATKQLENGGVVKMITISFRAHPVDAERIGCLAREANLSRAEYMLRSCLQEMPLGDTAEGRLEGLVERVERLEHAVSLGAGL